MEPINPSVWRKARRNTARKVSAVRTARGEYQGCPPRVVRGAARHPSMASALNHTVKLPRWRRPASYSRQFVILRFCRGIWWRRSWFSLKGTLGTVQRLGDYAAFANVGCEWDVGSNSWPYPEPSVPL